MNEAERIDYLIKTLAGNNARNFALRANIRPDTLSRVRNGKGKPSLYFERILTAFPGVERDWLYYGTGEPFAEEKERGEVLRKLDSLQRDVRALTEMVERLAEQVKNGL